jgi:hypothetical protein
MRTLKNAREPEVEGMTGVRKAACTGQLGWKCGTHGEELK